ncbi:MarR family transcriptional regulator [candidate division KSB1 bacterium]|nr:MarR family transcriptional regulator [candidate division KSB1 bacterium]MBL7093077.1 MarR family transcriptional regulator [candidate division KSB1 bacterium]
MKKEGAQKLAVLAPKIMNAFHDLGRQHPDSEKLSMRQFQALIILNASESLTISQLCEKLSLAPSTGTELVNRMITLGFLQKNQEKGDYRQVYISLNEKGEALLKHRQEQLSNMFSNFLAPFKPGDQEKFIQSFENIWVLMEKYHWKRKSM